MSSWNLPELNRWKPKHPSSLPLRIFKQYDIEIWRFMAAYYTSEKFTYSQLGKKGCKWSDSAGTCFSINTIEKSLTLKMWSDDLHKFDHWIRLNFLLSTCSYFETYISSIIDECIQSDPGMLFGVSNTIDGIKLLKYDHKIKEKDYKNKIIDCTKGDWNSRLNGFTQLFPNIPNVIQQNLSDLEKIRKLRNDVAHAFGRDIEESRNYENVMIKPMQTLSVKACSHYHHILFTIARNLDEYFLNNHIGNYEPLRFYHNLFPKIRNLDKGHKLVSFKKSIGNQKIDTFSKDFCRQIIIYYNNL